MAKYKLTARSYIHNTIFQEGAVVTVDDATVPGPHMIPVDAPAKKMAKEIGLVNDAPQDYVDKITGMTDVTAYGASPQTASGIANAPDMAHLTGQEGA